MIVQCKGPTLDTYWYTILIAHARSILEARIIYLNKTIIALVEILCIIPSTYTNSSSMDFINFKLVLRGILIDLHSFILYLLNNILMILL